MCLDIAYGVSYLHTSDDDKTCIIHRDIKSGNILLGENLEVKIADFGLSIFHPKNHPSRTINTEHCAGTHVYLDPEYKEEAQADRPKMEEVINGLKKAIDLQSREKMCHDSQKNRKNTLEIPLEDISLGGENFNNTNCNIEKGYGMYDGEVRYGNETKSVIIKRMSKFFQETPGSWREFEIPFKHKHENVIGLVGYCKKMNENFIVYENAINQSLDMHVGNATLTWTKRLKIGIDIGNGLKFLHGSGEGQDVVIHRDLKSSNILLTGGWKAKICGFDVSIIYPNNHNIRYTDDEIGGFPGCCDIYCFGVILFELLCGRLACTVRGQSLDSLFEGQFEVDRPDKLVFKRIREQIVWKSLVTFTTIAFNCLHDDRDKRPTASEVVVQLQHALELQVSYQSVEYVIFILKQ
ncbi:probable serine/threonine-protein kinase PBL28 [Rutidosis leptorrhynchoides]|uniref:probable serine/threonine-protein kinase PBL28 n=1 Tax=Rutidosis leptorrhynchoides TaxID=125765 RepID=UPI003A9A440D